MDALPWQSMNLPDIDGDGKDIEKAASSMSH